MTSYRQTLIPWDTLAGEFSPMCATLCDFRVNTVDFVNLRGQYRNNESMRILPSSIFTVAVSISI